MRLVAARRPPARWEVAAGFASAAAAHLAVLAVLIVGVKPPRPMPQTYAVELVAAPAGRPAPARARDVVERPAAPPEPAVSEAPAKTPVKTAPVPPRRTPEREPTPRASDRTADAPRKAPPAAAESPLPGETPGTGRDVANVSVPGIQFPYPEYLRNIVAQVLRRWSPPGGRALTAEVSFLIRRDGTVHDVRFKTPSGNFTFDLSAQGAIESAGSNRAFGPLPDGWEADVLPIVFFFEPRGGR
ncbi:MAG TPA: TonB C-terminal domain-containing protein [Gemmatimonadales bacterium]|nr:TonB C-terminal domain-containing protein [Gemmatimonadales bacterium]